MECACIRGSGQRFDFYLDFLDCDTIVFIDQSNWMEEDYYIIPDEYSMTIKFPNGTTKEVNFKPKGATTFTSESLGIGCFLDGIYCFSVDSCGYTYTRNDAILCSLECKRDSLVASLDINSNTHNYNKTLEFIKTIDVYLDSIKSNARIGKINLATKYFNIVQVELEKVECL
jgi:hypothetical protein